MTGPVSLLAGLPEQHWASFAHIVKQSVYGDGWSGFHVDHPPICVRRENGWCGLLDALGTNGGTRALPKRLGVFAATIEDGKPSFVLLRELREDDQHG